MYKPMKSASSTGWKMYTLLITFWCLLGHLGLVIINISLNRSVHRCTWWLHALYLWRAFECLLISPLLCLRTKRLQLKMSIWDKNITRLELVHDSYTLATGSPDVLMSLNKSGWQMVKSKTLDKIGKLRLNRKKHTYASLRMPRLRNQIKGFQTQDSLGTTGNPYKFNLMLKLTTVHSRYLN